MIAVSLLGALLAPASAQAQKPYFDIRSPRAPEIHGTRPLTGPAPHADRVARALGFARAHAGSLGLTAARVDSLGAPQRRSGGGVEQLRWRRSFGGIPAFDDELRVDLGADGAVLGASGAVRGAAPPSLTPALGPAEAMAVVMDDAGARGRPRVVAGPRGPRRDTGFAGGGRARLVVFGSRLGWRVDYPASRAAFYDTVVDASTGAILRRANLVKSDAPQANVWDDFPAGPSKPVGLDLATGATTLENQWIHAYSDSDGSDTAEASEEVAPGPYGLRTITTGNGCTAAKPCTWTPGTSDWTQNRAEEAVEAFYLAGVYREHLAAPPVAFQFDGTPGDKLLVETDWDALSGFDFGNTSMTTPPPGLGSHPTMNLNLFGGSRGFRAIAGGMDASIVFHEYTHGFTNRTVVDADGFQALNTNQAYAIDEGSADFFAKSFLVDEGVEADTAAPGEVDMGNYTDAVPHAIRREPLDCPVGAPAAECPGRGYTYADFGRIYTSEPAPDPEPHYDGEIWGETLWDLRRRLGPDLTTQLVAGALRLVDPEPSFLDMRDAILLEDTNLGRDDAAAIWQVFAGRGMGCDAATNGSDDAAPHAGFSVPPCGAPTPTPTATPQPTASATPTAAPEPTGSAAPTATPSAAPTATPEPTGSAARTARSQPTGSAAPTATPPRTVSATAPPTFTLRRSGRRGVAFAVTCRAACSVTATLRLSRPTAKRLHLGSRRTVGRLAARLRAAGRRSFTVRLDAAAQRALARAKPTSFRATLTARAVYPGAAATLARRTVTVRR